LHFEGSWLLDRCFDGKFALVTGASRGIGRAFAIAYANLGGTTGLVGRSEDALREVASEIESGGGRAEVFVTDLERDQAVRELPHRVEQAFGTLDSLVCCAGQYSQTPTQSSMPAEADPIWAVNVRAPLSLALGCRALLTRLSGELVFVGSSIVRSDAPELAEYAASKRALAGIADSLRASLNPAGVRVLLVHPGRTATRMQQEISALEGRAWEPARLLQPSDVADVIISALSLPRRAEVTEIHMRPFQRG
jgi:NADP-dependent 3-hydroxy acid dehydrogenase YdfG